jgi:nucleotide-binding universal stress UspA family protein
MRTVQRILVATDFSDVADRALERGIDLARQLKADVLLVHAYEIPVFGFPDGALIMPDVGARVAMAAQQELDALVARYADRGVPLRTILRMGTPWDEINDAATTESADIIVVGTHGRSGLARALLGSVAERVVRTAKHPVLVVSGSDESGAERA